MCAPPGSAQISFDFSIQNGSRVPHMSSLSASAQIYVSLLFCSKHTAVHTHVCAVGLSSYYSPVQACLSCLPLLKSISFIL